MYALQGSRLDSHAKDDLLRRSSVWLVFALLLSVVRASVGGERAELEAPEIVDEADAAHVLLEADWSLCLECRPNCFAVVRAARQGEEELDEFDVDQLSRLRHVQGLFLDCPNGGSEIVHALKTATSLEDLSLSFRFLRNAAGAVETQPADPNGAGRLAMAAIEAIGGLSGLRSLTLIDRSGELETTDWRPLEKLSRLTKMQILTGHLGRPQIQSVAKIRQLRELVLDELQEPLPDSALDDLSQLVALRRLVVWGGLGSDRPLAAFRKCHHLRSLVLDGLQRTKETGESHDRDARMRIVGEGLRELALLENLTLRNCSITMQGLRRLSKLPKLRQLTLVRCRFPDVVPLESEHVEFSGFDTLRVLNVLWSVDFPLAPFVSSVSLHELRIQGERSVDGIGRLPMLKRLHVHQAPAAHRDLLEVVTAGNNLKSFSSRCIDITGAEIDLLLGMKSIEHLKLADGIVNEPKMQRMKYPSRLRRVELSSVSGAVDGLVANLASINTLEEVELRRTSADAASSLKSLSRLPRLHTLRLVRSRYVTDDVLSRLKSFPALEHLDLSSSDITDDGLNELGECKSLKTLRINRTNVTIAGVENANIPYVCVGPTWPRTHTSYSNWDNF
jgi:hypothetical protein